MLLFGHEGSVGEDWMDLACRHESPQIAIVRSPNTASCGRDTFVVSDQSSRVRSLRS